MIQDNLLKSNFLGRDGFRWWIGHIPPIEAQGAQVNGSGWGNRYKVRIMGYHPYDTTELPDNDLPWAQVLLPTTAGTGGGNSATSTQIQPGDAVFGFFLDGDNAQIPVIMGCFGRTSEVSRSNPSGPFQPFTGNTKRVPKPNGTLARNESNESNATSAKSPSSIDQKTADKLNNAEGNNNNSPTKEISYYGGIGQEVVLANTCDDTAVKGISSEVNNLLNKVQNASNVFLNISNEINRSVEKIQSIANGFVGQMFDSLYNKFIGLLQDGLQLLYDTVFAKVFAETDSVPIAHLAGVAAQEAMVPPVKVLEEGISCVAAKVVNGLKGTIKELLKEVIKNVSNFVSCAGNQFVGAFLNNTIDKIVGGLSSALDGVSKILSPVFSVADFLRSSIDTIKAIGGLFDCNQSNGKCSGIVKRIIIGKGLNDTGNENEVFNTILSGMNISKADGNQKKTVPAKYTDKIITDDFLLRTKFLLPVKSSDTVITLQSTTGIKKGSLLATSSEIMTVISVNANDSEVTVSRATTGKATTYELLESVSVINPISKNKLNKVIEPSTFDQKYGKWDIFGVGTKSKNAPASPLGGCYTGEPTNCSSPKVRIFGGGGDGALATALLGSFVRNTSGLNEVVTSAQVTASIIGVQIDNPGANYRYPPFVEFVDNCNQGYGAVGRAIINESGQVTSIYIVSEGENYPIGDVEPYGVIDVVIQDTGTDYTVGDIAEDDLGNTYDLTIDNGRIVAAKPINTKVITDLPIITVISDTGIGAVLKPILGILPDSITNPDSPEFQKEIKQVIDCVT